MTEFWQIATPLITTVIMSLGIWRIQHLISKSDNKRDALEKCREEYQIMMLKSTNASITLGEATARALKDGHANGEVTRALEYAQKIKSEQHEWLQRQAAEKIC